MNLTTIRAEGHEELETGSQSYCHNSSPSIRQSDSIAADVHPAHAVPFQNPTFTHCFFIISFHDTAFALCREAVSSRLASDLLSSLSPRLHLVQQLQQRLLLVFPVLLRIEQEHPLDQGASGPACFLGQHSTEEARRNSQSYCNHNAIRCNPNTIGERNRRGI